MTDKYQKKKNSKAALFKKHKEILAWSAQISMYFVVAELNNVILEFTDVKAVTEGWSTPIYCPCELHLTLLQNPWYWNVNMGYRGQSPRGEPLTWKGQLAERSRKERLLG